MSKRNRLWIDETDKQTNKDGAEKRDFGEQDLVFQENHTSRKASIGTVSQGLFC